MGERVCEVCNYAEPGWRYNRCPNCGELNTPQPESQPQQNGTIPEDLKRRYQQALRGDKFNGSTLAQAIERIGRAEAALTLVREALTVAEEGLRTSYNVQEYPGDGTSTQDDALKVVRAALAATQPEVKG